MSKSVNDTRRCELVIFHRQVICLTHSFWSAHSCSQNGFVAAPHENVAIAQIPPWKYHIYGYCATRFYTVLMFVGSCCFSQSHKMNATLVGPNQGPSRSPDCGGHHRYPGRQHPRLLLVQGGKAMNINEHQPVGDLSPERAGNVCSVHRMMINDVYLELYNVIC